jgi:hypothetical protein
MRERTRSRSIGGPSFGASRSTTIREDPANRAFRLLTLPSASGPQLMWLQRRAPASFTREERGTLSVPHGENPLMRDIGNICSPSAPCLVSMTGMS